MKKRAFSDIVWGLIFFAFTLFMLWESTQARSGYGWSQYSNVFWPRIVLMVLLLLSVILTFRGIRKLNFIENDVAVQYEDLSDFDTGIVWGKIIGVGIIYIGYIILLPWLGFILTTPFFIILNMKILGEEKPLRIILIALITSTIFVLFFGKIIEIDLPRGIFFLKKLSRLIY